MYTGWDETKLSLSPSSGPVQYNRLNLCGQIMFLEFKHRIPIYSNSFSPDSYIIINILFDIFLYNKCFLQKLLDDCYQGGLSILVV